MDKSLYENIRHDVIRGNLNLEEAMYTGLIVKLIFEQFIEENGKQKPIVREIFSFPFFKHKVCLGKSTETTECYTIDLEEGLLIELGNNLFFPITVIETTLFHGSVAQIPLMGKASPDPIQRKTFIQQYYEDGRTEWQETISEDQWR